MSLKLMRERRAAYFKSSSTANRHTLPNDTSATRQVVRRFPFLHKFISKWLAFPSLFCLSPRAQGLCTGLTVKDRIREFNASSIFIIHSVSKVTELQAGHVYMTEGGIFLYIRKCSKCSKNGVVGRGGDLKISLSRY